MQAPTYDFNPTDWATITPLFDALRDGPVAAGGFMDWLAQWNQLDIDVWDAYTQLKHPAYVDTSNHQAEAIYQAYVKELYSTYVGHTNTLISKALRLQPEPPTPNHQQLWRRWHNQRALSSPVNLPIQSEISQLENHYRTIMGQYDGTPDELLTYWLDRRDALNELMMRLLKLRRTLAHNSGVPTYLAYRWRELNRLDYSIADCQSFHRAIAKIVPAIAEFRARGILSEQPFPEVDSVARLTEGVERILRQVDPAFGDIFHAMRDGYLDLGHRSHKAASFESWFFPGAGLPYIHAATANAGTVFHESGHGIHDTLSFRAHGSLWNFSGPEEFQEFAATSLDMLCWPYYAQTQGGLYTTAESAVARQSVMRLYIDMTASVLQDAFEHWLYGEATEDVTPADLDAKWLELKARFEPWDDDYASADEKMTGWQRNTWSLFRMPLYMITYPLATVGTCLLARLAQRDRVGVIKNYKMALTLGNTQTLPDLFSTVGLTFPFTEQAVAEAIQFIFDQSLESTKQETNGSPVSG